MNIQEIKSKSISELISLSEEYGLNNNSSKNKRDLIFSVIKHMLNNSQTELTSTGVLEVLQDGFGFLRSAEANYLPGIDDVYVSPVQIKRFGLSTGNIIDGKIKSLQNGEKYISLSRILTVNDQDPKLNKRVVSFDNLVPLYPQEQLALEVPDKKNITGRIIDLVAPMGKGQRALIVSPPRAGKTVILQSIAKSLELNYPEIYLIVLLIDERPEEVTDMQRLVRGEVISSTFDEPAYRHVQVAEVVLEKVKRLTEHGKDVVVLLDSITRLARAYNTIVPSSGKILTGGVDANALQRPKRFLGAARNIDNGGSLSIIATALVDTGSKMDEVIFEEFKGTGNCELVIDRRLADKRIFPAIDIMKSGTRKEELLVSPDALSKMWILRRVLTNMGTVEGMEFLLNKIRGTDDNKKFFESMKG